MILPPKFKSILVLFVVGIFPNCLSATEFPVYGNWCGLGHPSELETGGELPIAIDQIDDACKKHDFAYENTEPWGNSEADHELVEKLTDILNDGHQWVYQEYEDFEGKTQTKKHYKEEITESQFLKAAAIIAYMSRQQIVTLYSDILRGKVSSVIKVVLSEHQIIVQAPIILTNQLMSKLAKELDGPEISLIEATIKTGELAVKFTIEVDRLQEKIIDEVGDISEVFIDKLGEETGLDKPIRRLEKR